jgi:hypothetical protein
LREVIDNGREGDNGARIIYIYMHIFSPRSKSACEIMPTASPQENPPRHGITSAPRYRISAVGADNEREQQDLVVGEPQAKSIRLSKNVAIRGGTK